MKCATLRERGTGKTALKAARIAVMCRVAALDAGLSVPMVVWARRVLTLGTPELIAAVEAGTVALYVAARVSRWSVAAQREFLSRAQPTRKGVTFTMRCVIVPSKRAPDRR